MGPPFKTQGLGSSPHTRGAPSSAPDLGREGGIIPAYAGSTRIRRDPGQEGQDHPRIRGEHTNKTEALGLSQGSSPHTRGAPVDVGDHLPQLRIIPAYAGSTLGNPCNTKDRRRDYTSFPLPVTHPSGGGGS